MPHTPGEWKWWTSCSWRRLRSEQGHGKTLDVLMPVSAPDGQPDIIVSDEDMNMIEAAPEMIDALRQWAWAELNGDAAELVNARASRDMAIIRATGQPR
jgi:hypothetical protein